MKGHRSIFESLENVDSIFKKPVGLLGNFKKRTSGTPEKSEPSPVAEIPEPLEGKNTAQPHIYESSPERDSIFKKSGVSLGNWKKRR